MINVVNKFVEKKSIRDRFFCIVFMWSLNIKLLDYNILSLESSLLASFIISKTLDSFL